MVFGHTVTYEGIKYFPGMDVPIEKEHPKETVKVEKPSKRSNKAIKSEE